MSSNSPLASAVQLLGRILLCYMFIMAGYSKLLNHDGTVGYIASGNMPLPAEFSYWAAVAIEFGCGILVVVGFLARPAALAIAVFSLMTGYFFHYLHDVGEPATIENNMVNFQKNISIAGGALFIAAAGAGGWSIDALIFGGRKTSAAYA